MKQEQIEEQYKQVLGLLDDHRLKEALELLHSMSLSCGNYQLQEELHGVQTSYGYMLQYMEQGMHDPERDKLYHDLLIKSYCLADQVYLLLREDYANQLYFNGRKQDRNNSQACSLQALLATLESFPDSLSLYALLHDEQKLQQDLEKHETALGELFRTTWVNSRWTNAERDVAYKYLSSELITANDLSLFVSAVTMSLMACFDEAKMLWLIEAFYHKDNMVKVRAQVGFVMVSHLHEKRIGLYSGILARIGLIQDEQPSFADDINTIYLQLIRSQDTERINKTMQEEIVPTVMKNIQSRKQKPLDEGDELDMNPEWLFDLGPKLNNKMRKIGELQLEGSDVNMGMFSMLKRFPFFNRIENWFYPYEPMHSDVIKAMGNNPGTDKRMEILLMQLGMLCDSDCYSTVFMMNQMSESQRKELFGQLMNESMGEMTEEALNESHAAFAKSVAVICKYYIHNLYRFFKLFPQKAEFHDIFLDNLKLEENTVLKPLLCEARLMRQVADLLFKTERFQDATPLYGRLVELRVADKDVFQRLGYCFEHKAAYPAAIKCYVEANVMASGNKWTLRHLATCYRHQDAMKEALDCYRELVSLEPENLSYNYHLGTCLVELGEYEEALQCFYKMDLAEEDNIKAWRGIAWCSFQGGKLDKALQYYGKIIAMQPTDNDWLNAGHVAWCNGQLPQAVDYYRKAAGDDFQAFRSLYLKDSKLMQEKGISQTDFLLMLDLL